MPLVAQERQAGARPAQLAQVNLRDGEGLFVIRPLRDQFAGRIEDRPPPQKFKPSSKPTLFACATNVVNRQA